MRYYRMEGEHQNAGWIGEGDEEKRLRARCRSLAGITDLFNAALEGKAYFFVSVLNAAAAVVGVIVKEEIRLDRTLAAFLKKTGLTLKETFRKEITLEELQRMLRSAWRIDAITEDCEDVLEHFELNYIGWDYIRRSEYKEHLLQEAGRETAYDSVARIPMRETILPELDRIYAGEAHPRVTGHPVHYFIETDDGSIRRSVCAALLAALYDRKRLRMRRYGFVNLAGGGYRATRGALDCVYRSFGGGAVVIDYSDQILYEEDDEYASPNRAVIESVAETIRSFASGVLTVICLPRSSEKLKNLFQECLGSMTFVELKEELLRGGKALDFLRLLAADSGVRPDRGLLEEPEADRGYSVTELKDMYHVWYNRKLKTRIYPQYRELVSAGKAAGEKQVKGSAWEELMGMIGLAEAKRTIRQALNYYKAQRLFADKGIRGAKPAMHMVFSGNPGTAKTTVARLFARIMKDNELLSSGKLVETGRGELVGKYVGWTAPNIQRKFREAKGGVLFIDEAYSLVDDRDGSFGDEAINTIVQEMENHREDTIVIFAGYPDRMEEFIRKNPGLRSRIAFHVPFEDYSAGELTDIAGLLAKENGFTLTEEAGDRIRGIMEEALKTPDFGNGRFVRNLLDRARMAQADRLLSQDPDRITRKEVTTIRAEDIEAPKQERRTLRKIGFGSIA